MRDALPKLSLDKKALLSRAKAHLKSGLPRRLSRGRLPSNLGGYRGLTGSTSGAPPPKVLGNLLGGFSDDLDNRAHVVSITPPRMCSRSAGLIRSERTRSIRLPRRSSR